MMSALPGGRHMRASNGQFETLYVDDPEGRTKYWYINCWRQQTVLTRYLQG